MFLKLFILVLMTNCIRSKDIKYPDETQVEEFKPEEMKPTEQPETTTETEPKKHCVVLHTKSWECYHGCQLYVDGKDWYEVDMKEKMLRKIETPKKDDCRCTCRVFEKHPLWTEERFFVEGEKMPFGEYQKCDSVKPRIFQPELLFEPIVAPFPFPLLSPDYSYTIYEV